MGNLLYLQGRRTGQFLHGHTGDTPANAQKLKAHLISMLDGHWTENNRSVLWNNGRSLQWNFEQNDLFQKDIWQDIFVNHSPLRAFVRNLTLIRITIRDEFCFWVLLAKMYGKRSGTFLDLQQHPRWFLEIFPWYEKKWMKEGYETHPFIWQIEEN